MFEGLFGMLALVGDALGEALFLDWYLDGGPKDHSEFFIRNADKVLYDYEW